MIREDETGESLLITQGGSKKAHRGVAGSKDISKEVSELPTSPTKWLLWSSAGVLTAILNRITNRSCARRRCTLILYCSPFHISFSTQQILMNMSKHESRKTVGHKVISFLMVCCTCTNNDFIGIRKKTQARRERVQRWT